MKRDLLSVFSLPPLSPLFTYTLKGSIFNMMKKGEEETRRKLHFAFYRFVLWAKRDGKRNVKEKSSTWNPFIVSHLDLLFYPFPPSTSIRPSIWVLIHLKHLLVLVMVAIKMGFIETKRKMMNFYSLFDFVIQSSLFLTSANKSLLNLFPCPEEFPDRKPCEECLFATKVTKVTWGNKHKFEIEFAN